MTAPTRDERIADMRRLLTWLKQHPEVPLPDLNVQHCILTEDDENGLGHIAIIASDLDVEPTSNPSGTHHYATRLFGTASYQAFYVTAGSMAAHSAGQRHVRRRPGIAGRRRRGRRRAARARRGGVRVTAPVVHHFTCQVGSQPDVPMSLVYLAPEVHITVASRLVWTVSRTLLAESLIFPVRSLDDAVFGAHVIDDLVVIDLALGLPLHIVCELADVEEFLNGTYDADPEPLDEAELAAAPGGVR